MRARGELVWAADEQGGGPFLYPDPDDPRRMIGFEIELAGLIAAELGVRQRFQQGQWEQLPQLLDREMVDVVLNGYEWTPERAQRYRCSRPYYAFGLQLLARGDGPIGSWADLEPHGERPAARVGMLAGSEPHIAKFLSPSVVRVFYDTNTDAMQHVQAGLLDATIADDCVALFYADRFPKLRFVGRPVGQGYYVALLRQQDERLHAAIDKALATLIADGRLRALYDRYGLWGRSQEFVLRDSSPGVPQARSSASVVWSNLGLLLQSAAMTVLLALASMPLAITVGVLVAIGRLFGPRPLAGLLAVYVEVLRGTPLMLQLYAIFFLLPELGIAVPALAAAIFGLAVNYSAYEAEIYRAGFQAIPRGQWEAATALGLTPFQTIRYILFPQAFRLVLPPVTNDFIALFKDTSVCSVVTVVELTKRYNVLAQSTGAIVELATVTAILYLLMSYPLSLFARWSEQRLARGESS